MAKTGERCEVHPPVFLWEKSFLFLNDTGFFKCVTWGNSLQKFNLKALLECYHSDTVALKHAKLLPTPSRMSWISMTMGSTEDREALHTWTTKGLQYKLQKIILKMQTTFIFWVLSFLFVLNYNWALYPSTEENFRKIIIIWDIGHKIVIYSIELLLRFSNTLTIALIL